MNVDFYEKSALGVVIRFLFPRRLRKCLDFSLRVLCVIAILEQSLCLVELFAKVQGAVYHYVIRQSRDVAAPMRMR